MALGDRIKHRSDFSFCIPATATVATFATVDLKNRGKSDLSTPSVATVASVAVAKDENEKSCFSCGHHVGRENYDPGGVTQAKGERPSPVAIDWLHEHRTQLRAAGWTMAELYRHDKSRGIIWAGIWDKPFFKAVILEDGIIKVEFVDGGRDVVQTARPLSFWRKKAVRLIGGKTMSKKLFQVGNPGGPGRPKRQTEASYLAAMLEAVPLETWKQICERAVTDALAGDEKARGWLAKYLMGEPSIKAPAPTQVIIQQLLNKDPAFDAAVNCLVDTRMLRLLYPLIHEDDDLRERIAENARLEIINMEERTATTQANNNNTTTNYNEQLMFAPALLGDA